VFLFETFARAVGFLALISLVFIPLEYYWRNRPSASKKDGFFLRQGWLNDITFYLGQALVFNTVTIVVLSLVFDHIDASTFLPSSFLQSPLILRVGIVVVLSDLLIYWGHRAQHKFAFLWRFHRVHHTAEHVDFLAAYREHPLDNIYTRGIETLPAILLGLDLGTIAGFVTFRGLWAIFIHSNVSIRLGFIEKLVGAPHLHHWHHELTRRGLCNYANLSPLMDIIFGTYYSPERRPETYGTAESVRQNWFWQMLDPFWKMAPSLADQSTGAPADVAPAQASSRAVLKLQ
jgi:sterol desaturase/sphingolipid hydroxylase (fatty acid hydroxylase superfamily)